MDGGWWTQMRGNVGGECGGERTGGGAEEVVGGGKDGFKIKRSDKR